MVGDDPCLPVQPCGSLKVEVEQGWQCFGQAAITVSSAGTEFLPSVLDLGQSPPRSFDNTSVFFAFVFLKVLIVFDICVFFSLFPYFF